MDQARLPDLKLVMTIPKSPFQTESLSQDNALKELERKQRRYRIYQFMGGAIVICTFMAYVVLRLIGSPFHMGKPLTIGLIVLGILVSIYFSWKARQAAIKFYRNDL